MRPRDPFIGRDILNGSFHILQKIGSGGMGAVYRALQRQTNRLVGVKILHPKLANRRDLVSRFRREARTLSQLTHPNNVQVFLYGELDDGSLYIVMEFLEGKNLNQTTVAEGPFPMDRALPILIQVCGALDEAHQVGIIHRDLKPENIFLMQSNGLRDFPKVLDFGLAKVGEPQMGAGSFFAFGTPEFMSPEQAQGFALTPASDIYALAVILYEVLTGKLPFNGKSASNYMELHVTGTPIPLNQRVPGKQFSPLLESAIARALAKRPEDRVATAAEFATELQRVLECAVDLPGHLATPHDLVAEPFSEPDAMKAAELVQTPPPRAQIGDGPSRQPMMPPLPSFRQAARDLTGPWVIGDPTDTIGLSPDASPRYEAGSPHQDSLHPRATLSADPVTILNECFAKARMFRDGHYRAAIRLQQDHYRLGLPTIVLSAIVGSTVFAALEKSEAQALPFRIAITVMSLAVAVFASLQTFLRFAERSEKHRTSSASYEHVVAEIRVMRMRIEANVDEKVDLIDAAGKMMSRMADLLQSSPELAVGDLSGEPVKVYADPGM